MLGPAELAKRFEKINHQLGDATLVAVTKYSDVLEVNLAYDLGHRDFGENRVADLAMKANSFKDSERTEVRWHFIGQLQSNKVAKLLKAPGLYAIHSVDSHKLLLEILRRQTDLIEPVRIFFQVNTSGEKEKSGYDNYEDLENEVDYFLNQKTPALIFDGLMTMGTYRTDDRSAEAKRCFKKLKDYGKRLEAAFSLSHLKLSMGMSDDYQIALDEGADVVRVGSLLFK